MSLLKCPECKQDNGAYCRLCNPNHWRDNLQNWTSGNDDIDKLIQESQLIPRLHEQLLEWIEYSNLKDIEHLAEGGFGSVYKAIWKDGPIKYTRDDIKHVEYFWDVEKSKWIREGETVVAVKKYRDATSVSSEFLNEVNKSNKLK